MANVNFVLFLWVMLFSISAAQVKPYGFRLSDDVNCMSTAFVIQNGFVLDSAVFFDGYTSKAYRFEYNENGKLKRDINILKIIIRVIDTINGRPLSRYLHYPGTRDYFYNITGAIDSIRYGYFTDSSWVNQFMGLNYYYSPNGKLMSTQSTSNGIESPWGNYVYNEFGNLISSTSFLYLSPPSSIDTTYNLRTYDSQQRLIVSRTITIPYGNPYSRTVYQYDSLGNIGWFKQNIYFRGNTGLHGADLAVIDTMICDTEYVTKGFLKFDEIGKVTNYMRWNNYSGINSVNWQLSYDDPFYFDSYNRIVSIRNAAFHYNTDGNLDSLINRRPASDFSGPILADSYGNTATIPNDGGGWFKFYYSQKPSGSSSEPIMHIPCSSLSFGNVAKDSIKSISFNVTNTSSNLLVISSISTGTKYFTVNIDNANVDQSSPLTLKVQFKSDKIGFFADTLYIRNNSSASLVKIILYGYSPLPRIHISARNLKLADKAVADTAEATIAITNSSVNSFIVDSVATQTKSFQSSITGTEVTIQDTLHLKVRFIPKSFGELTDSLIVYSTSDTARMVIGLSGFSPFPKLKVVPASVEFGQVKKDSTRQQILAFMDSSLNTIRIDTMFTRTKYFKVVHSLTNNSIKQSDTVFVTMNFTPDSTGAFYDTLVIASNSVTSPLKIPLSGNAQTSGVQIGESIPHEYALSQNYPNPFNPSTVITYSLPKISPVMLKVYDLLGREIATLANEKKNAGIYNVTWYANNVPSGVYFYRLTAGEYSKVNKMILLK